MRLSAARPSLDGGVQAQRALQREKAGLDSASAGVISRPWPQSFICRGDVGTNDVASKVAALRGICKASATTLLSARGHRGKTATLWAHRCHLHTTRPPLRGAVLAENHGGPFSAAPSAGGALPCPGVYK